MTNETAHFFPEKPFLYRLPGKEGNERCISARGNIAKRWKENGQWSSGHGIKRTLSFLAWKLA